MGVDVVVGEASIEEFVAVTQLFDVWERTFSRFRPESELNRINGNASSMVLATPLFARVLRTALVAASATAGLVDPTLAVALEAAGYDRDFTLLDDDPRPLGASAIGSWRSIRLEGRLLSRPPGVLLDLNGVVKGLVVDEAVELLSGRGFVSAGGDITTLSPVVAELPGGDSIRVLAGGLATSGKTGRYWRRHGAIQHHLIDPRTGRPSNSRWDQVTTAAASCLAADVAAKAAFLLSDDGPDWLDERGLPGRFVGGDTIVANAVWQQAEGAAEAAAAA